MQVLGKFLQIRASLISIMKLAEKIHGEKSLPRTHQRLIRDKNSPDRCPSNLEKFQKRNSEDSLAGRIKENF
jgi:hypothetical protein